MLPTLVALGPVRISSFGVMAVIAFFLGGFVVWRQGREAHFDEERIFDAILVGVFWGLVGGRLVYGLEHGAEFGADLLMWVSLAGRPGLSLFGALVAGGISLWWFARRAGWNFWETTDVFMPGVTLAVGIGWIGAFLNGVGYGVMANLPWAVVFPGVEGARHPTQVYSALGFLVVFWLLIKFEKEYRTYDWYRGKRSEAAVGFVFLMSLVGMGLLGLGVALLQPVTFFVGRLTLPVIEWLTLVLGGVIGLYVRSGRSLGGDLGQLAGKLSVKRQFRPEHRKSQIGGGIKRGSVI